MSDLLAELNRRFVPAFMKRQESLDEEARRIIARIPKLLQKAADAGETECKVFDSPSFHGDDPISLAIREWAQSQGLSVRSGIRELNSKTTPLILYGWAKV